MPFLYSDPLTVVVAVVMSVIIRNNRWAGMKNKVFSSTWIAKKFNEGSFILTPPSITIYVVALSHLIELIQLQYFSMFFPVKFNSCNSCCLSTVWRAQLHKVHSSNHPTYYSSVPKKSFNFKFIFGPGQYFLTNKLMADFNFFF